MKQLFLFTLITTMIAGCKEENRQIINPQAVEYNNEAVQIMMNSRIEADSFAYAIELMDKAIDLAPGEPFYRDTKAKFYQQYGRMDLAKECFLESWALSQKNYTVALSLGAFYEYNNQLDSAKFYYNRSLVSIDSNFKKSDINIKINRALIERMLGNEINFTPLEREISKQSDPDILVSILNSIENSSRKELLDMILNTND